MQPTGTNSESHSQTIGRDRYLGILRSKKDVSIKSLPSGIREPFRRGWRKSVGVTKNKDTKERRIKNRLTNIWPRDRGSINKACMCLYQIGPIAEVDTGLHNKLKRYL